MGSMDARKTLPSAVLTRREATVGVGIFPRRVLLAGAIEPTARQDGLERRDPSTVPRGARGGAATRVAAATPVILPSFLSLFSREETRTQPGRPAATNIRRRYSNRLGFLGDSRVAADSRKARESAQGCGCLWKGTVSDTRGRRGHPRWFSRVHSFVGAATSIPGGTENAFDQRPITAAAHRKSNPSRPDPRQRHASISDPLARHAGGSLRRRIRPLRGTDAPRVLRESPPCSSLVRDVPPRGHRGPHPQKRQRRRCQHHQACLLYTSPSPRDKRQSRMPSSA